MRLAVPATRAGKLALALLIANELRGACVVAGVLFAAHGRIF